MFEDSQVKYCWCSTEVKSGRSSVAVGKRDDIQRKYRQEAIPLRYFAKTRDPKPVNELGKDRTRKHSWSVFLLTIFENFWFCKPLLWHNWLQQTIDGKFGKIGDFNSNLKTVLLSSLRGVPLSMFSNLVQSSSLHKMSDTSSHCNSTRHRSSASALYRSSSGLPESWGLAPGVQYPAAPSLCIRT